MLRWSLALVASLLLVTSRPAAQARVLVLEGGTLIDGTGRPPVADAVIVIEGERIRDVGTKGRVPHPPGANVIKLDGRTIIPGLIDGHVHLREYQIPMFLAYGITTIADIHNDTSWSLAQREALKSGRMKGPRLFVSGARVTGPLGRPTKDGSYVRTVAEARAYVRSLAAAGVDHIKVDLTITDDQLRAVIEEAKAANLRVLGHTQNIRTAVEMGFRHMEHTDTMARALLAQTGQNVPPGSSPEAVVDPALFPPLIDYLVKQGVYVNPTLVLVWSASTNRPREWKAEATQVANDPRLAFVPADAKAAWTSESGRPPRDGYANVKEFLRKYSESGGKILAATDTGIPPIVPGLSLHQEMQMLTDAGVPPMKAIQGATLWAAEVIGRDKSLGSIEPGKLADLTVIDGNPLADISVTKRVRTVIKGGEVMDTTYDPQWRNPIPRNVSTP
jgi:imidazolonepropionase-like amidohydrolase